MRVPTAPIDGVQPDGGSAPAFRIDAQPAAFGGQSAQAETALAGDVDKAGDLLERHALVLQGMANETLANDAQTSAIKQATARITQYRSLEGKAAVDAYPQFQEDIGNLRTAGVASLPNPMAKQQFDSSFRRYEDSMLEAGSTYAAQQNKHWMVQSSESASANFGDQAVLFRNDPSKVDLFANSGADEIRKQGEIQGWDGETLKSHITDFNGQVYRKVVDALHTDDPQRAQDYYDSIKDRLGGFAQATIEADLKRGGEENSAILRGSVERRFQNNVASAFDTGNLAEPLTPTEIHAAFGQKDPAVADHMIRQLQGAQEVGAAKANMGLTGPEQDAETMARFAPKLGADYDDQTNRYNNVVTAYNQKWKALGEDPATYVLKASPQIAQAFQAAGKDPSQLPAAVAAMDGAYDQLGVPSYARSVLPLAAAQGAVKSILASPDAASRAASIEQMQQRYGDVFPRIMGDLVKAKLPPAYEVLAALPNQADRVALANGIGDGAKPARAALPEHAANDIDKAVQDDPNFESLTRSMSYASGGAAKAGELVNVAKLIGYGHALGGAAPADAAAKAVASFTTAKYDFWENGGAGGDAVARVPRGQAADVERAADITLSALKPEQVVIPAYAKVEGASPETVARAAMLTIQRGKWVTAGSDDRLVRIDSNGYPVTLANGQPLSLPFSAVKGILASPVPPTGKPNIGAPDLGQLAP